MAEKILIIEDEPKFANLLSDYLLQSGYETGFVANGLDAVMEVRKQNPALILLDLMLPGKDGLEICREIRAFSPIPVIIITARVEELDRILGLELGADDYICKPFSPREVVARVKTVLRRVVSTSIESSGLILDRTRYSVMLNGTNIDLTALEFNLLHFLMSNPGRIYGRQQLMDKIYPDERIVSDRTIDSHVKKLRRKLAQAAPDTEIIHSIYGIGYRFDFPQANQSIIKT